MKFKLQPYNQKQQEYYYNYRTIKKTYSKENLNVILLLMKNKLKEVIKNDK